MSANLALIFDMLTDTAYVPSSHRLLIGLVTTKMGLRHQTLQSLARSSPSPGSVRALSTGVQRVKLLLHRYVAPLSSGSMMWLHCDSNYLRLSASLPRSSRRMVCPICYAHMHSTVSQSHCYCQVRRQPLGLELGPSRNLHPIM